MMPPSALVVPTLYVDVPRDAVEPLFDGPVVEEDDVDAEDVVDCKMPMSIHPEYHCRICQHFMYKNA